MALIDPRFGGTVPPRSHERYSLKIHEIAPEDIAPNGDRYTIEVIDLDESVMLGSLLVVTQGQPTRPGDPQADPTIENRGVIAGVIIAAGNGHLLGLPDAKLAVEGEVMVSPADVPMFYGPGDVVLVDYNAKGRALKIVGREIRIVAQIDVLAKINGIRLERKDNAWAPQE